MYPITEVATHCQESLQPLFVGALRALVACGAFSVTPLAAELAAAAGGTVEHPKASPQAIELANIEAVNTYRHGIL